MTNITASRVADSHTAVDLSWSLPERGDSWYKFVVSCHSEIEGSEYCPAQARGTFPYKAGRLAATNTLTDMQAYCRTEYDSYGLNAANIATKNNRYY